MPDGRGREKVRKFLAKGKEFLKENKILSKYVPQAVQALGTAVGHPELGAAIGAKAGEKLEQAGYGLNLGGRAPMVRGMYGSGRKRRTKAAGAGKRTSMVGTRAQVLHGTKMKTSGGLTAADLMLNKRGHIVSKRKHALGKTVGLQRLIRAGYKTTKGVFKLFPKKR